MRYLDSATQPSLLLIMTQTEWPADKKDAHKNCFTSSLTFCMVSLSFISRNVGKVYSEGIQYGILIVKFVFSQIWLGAILFGVKEVCPSVF